MRKKLCFMVMMLFITASLLIACGDERQKKDAASPDQAVGSGAGNADNNNSGRVEEETDVSEFEYKEEDGKIVITVHTGPSTDVVIPAQIDGKDVVAIGRQCFKNESKLTRVICPETLITIGEQAFINCTSLSEISLNEGLQEIGVQAFLPCYSLEKVDFPSTLTTLSYSSFGLSGLKEVTIPDTLSEIPEGCFCSTYITTVTIPANIKTVGEGAFEGCSNLEKVVIEEGVERIDSDAFAQCKSLKEINIPQSVTEMGESIFWATGNVVVTVYPGSVAETYAKENYLTYVNP